MKKLTMLLVAISMVFTCVNAQAKNKSGNKVIESKESLNFVKATNDLLAPESVVFDEENKVLLVSCQAGEVPGDGSIAKVSLEGKILNPKFVSGLNNPKGIAISDGKIYVADLLELVEIDLQTGAVLKKYTQDKIQFMNDVTVDKAGNVYVSDMFISSIYKLDKKKNFSEWFSSPDMDNPNGLLAIGKEIYIGGWGKFNDGKSGLAPQGRFQKINIKTKQITTITPNVLGNLDGVQVNDKNSFIVSDWKGGKVYKVGKNGSIEELLSVEQGVGDILYLPKKGMLVLPMKKQNQILFYQVK